MQTKICTKCRKKRYINEYYFREDRGRADSICKRCIRSYRRNTPNNVWLYGLTINDYALLVEKQNGLCAICYSRDRMRRLSVDHDHGTNKVRGLLCLHCNSGLAYFNDNPNMMLNAIIYLAKNK